MGSKVELFEQIRRDRDREGLSIRELAGRHGVHRRTVRQALASPLPPERKRPESRPAPKLGPYRELIDSWLLADRDAPPKQRHTARRIFERLHEEHGGAVSERQVRRYVRQRRRELGEAVEAFVPQVHEPGAEAEVDWGEAQVLVRGRRTRVYLFHLRACHSGAAFVMAFPRQSQQAFLEGHVEAFSFFGGVFELIRYDNLRAAVKQVLRGRRREESDRFVALRSHYLFDSSSRCRAGRAPTRRAGSSPRSGAFAAATWCPCPRSAP
jgi:transposase